MPKINFNRNIDIKPTKLTWKIFIGLIITMGLMIGITMGFYIPGISKFAAIIRLLTILSIYIPIIILSFLLPSFTAKYLVESANFTWVPSTLGLIIAIISDILFLYILSLIISKIISHLKNKHPSNHNNQ